MAVNSKKILREDKRLAKEVGESRKQTRRKEIVVGRIISQTARVSIVD